jgi:Flp pilus assembly protein TadG
MRARFLEHDPAICDQPPDKRARQNKGLERDASGKADSNRSHPALGTAGSTTIQFAITALPFFLLVLSIIEGSLVFWSWQALEGAAIDAGRCAALEAPLCGNPATSVTATQNYAVTAANARGLSNITTANVTVLTGASAEAQCGNTTASVVTIGMTYHYAMMAFIPLPSNLSVSACFPLAS